MAPRLLLVPHPSDIPPAEVEIYPSAYEERQLLVSLPGRYYAGLMWERWAPACSRCTRRPAKKHQAHHGRVFHPVMGRDKRSEASDKRVFEDGSVISARSELVAGG